MEKAGVNIDHLRRLLEYNVQNNLRFLRIGSGVMPFASHKINTIRWWEPQVFGTALKEIGDFVKHHDIRLSMHPDQFTLLNSPNAEITARSISELEYHARFLDAMEVDATAKIQIHCGGVYGMGLASCMFKLRAPSVCTCLIWPIQASHVTVVFRKLISGRSLLTVHSPCSVLFMVSGNKDEAIDRLVQEYHKLSPAVKRRLVIENDDRLFSLKDCLRVHTRTGVPILFDNLHHECLNENEPMREALIAAMKTWKPEDGVPLIDYSSQEPDARRGNHAETLDPKHFAEFIRVTEGLSYHMMLEIKDKEPSALRALKLAAHRLDHGLLPASSRPKVQPQLVGVKEESKAMELTEEVNVSASRKRKTRRAEVVSVVKSESAVGTVAMEVSVKVEQTTVTQVKPRRTAKKRNVVAPPVEIPPPLEAVSDAAPQPMAMLPRVTRRVSARA